VLAMAPPLMLPSVSSTTSAPRTNKLSRLDGWPICSPTDVSTTPSRAPPTARGRCGSLLLHRGGLLPPTPCRFDRRTEGLVKAQLWCPDHGCRRTDAARQIVQTPRVPIASESLPHVGFQPFSSSKNWSLTDSWSPAENPGPWRLTAKFGSHRKPAISCTP
jgi:hypothetical protein